MSEDEHVENVVLGGGEAGKHVAWELAAQGKPVVVIERALIGGACPNIACLPSKNEIRSAKVAYLARHGAEYGVHAGTMTVDMAGVRARKRKMVEEEIEFHCKMFSAPGVTYLLGEGRLVAPRAVEVQLTRGGTRRFVAHRLFLDLGTHASVPDVPGLADAAPLTHVEALELDRVPPHLIVIGGGYVAVELAQAFRRFGSEVTMLVRGSQLVTREDPDVAAELRAIFESEGIAVKLGTYARSVAGAPPQLRVHVQTPAGEEMLAGSHVLVAVGRTPNTRGIGLEEAGIALDPRGYIQVDDRLQTTAAGVWAMGECAGSPQFTHVARDDYRVVRDNLAGRPHSTRGRLVPYCVFSDPELAHVGLHEAAGRRDGVAMRVARLPMALVQRAHTTGEQRGFMKLLAEPSGDRILGFTMLGADAGEVVAVVQTAMLAGLPYTALRDALLPHPTMAEGLGPLLATLST